MKVRWSSEGFDAVVFRDVVHLPQSRPLSEGAMIQAGSLVIFVTMPPGIETLPEESRRVFRFCLGRTYRVEEIDRWGLVILDVSADIDHLFGGFMNEIHVEPEFLREVSWPTSRS